MTTTETAMHEEAPPPPPDLAGRHPLLWILVGAVLAVASAIALAYVVDLREVSQVLTTLQPGLLAVAFGAKVASLACYAGVYRAACRTVRQGIDLREAAGVSLGAYALARTLPGGGVAGGVYAAYRLARRGGDIGTATAAVFLANMLAMATLAAIVTVGAGVAAVGDPTKTPFAIASLVVCLLFAAGLALGDRALRSAPTRARILRFAVRVKGWLGKRAAGIDIDAWGHSFDQLAARAKRRRRSQGVRGPATVIAWSTGFWGFDIVVLWLVLGAAGAGFAPLPVLLAYGLANLINALPLTPGGVGLVEAGLAATLIALGIDPAAAAVGTVGYRVLSQWLPVLVGTPMALRSLRAERVAVAA